MPTAAPKTINVDPPNLKSIVVTIKGVTPLLTDNGEAAVEKLVEQQRGPKQKGPKVARDAEADFKASRYFMADGKDGFPGRGVKRSLKDAAIRNGAGIGTQVSAQIQIDAELIEIDSKEPIMATHYVRHGGRVADLAYRAQFTAWKMNIPTTYNAGVIALEQVISLFQLAGFSIGIGAWRPEKNGTFGRFIVEGVKE